MAPPRAGHRWTRNEDQTLIDLYRSGKDEIDIGQEVGRTEGAILARLGKLFLEPNGLAFVRFRNPPGSVSPKQSGRIIKSFLQGTPVDDLAVETGVNVFEISYHLLETRLLDPIDLDEMNYPKANPRGRSKADPKIDDWSPELDCALFELWNENASLETMTESLRRSRWEILQRLYTRGHIVDRDLEKMLADLREVRALSQTATNKGLEDDNPEKDSPEASSIVRERMEVPLPLPGDPIGTRRNGRREHYRNGEDAELRARARKARFW